MSFLIGVAMSASKLWPRYHVKGTLQHNTATLTSRWTGEKGLGNPKSAEVTQEQYVFQTEVEAGCTENLRNFPSES